jgi:hypothetical protein
VAAFEIRAEKKVAYRTREVALPGLSGRHPFVLNIEAPSVNPRPLGIALDWIQLDRGSLGARFELLDPMRLRLLVVLLLAFVGPRLAGAGRGLSILHAGVLLSAATLGIWWDLLASDRIVGEGLGPYASSVLLAVVLARWRGSRRALRLEGVTAAGAVALLALVAVAVRLWLLLHPQFFYPDVHVHGQFAWILARRGLGTFLADFTANQFRYSLGLQFENGHWYAFPYPPVFYLLTWPLTRLAGYRPEVAVSILPAVVNGLQAFLIYGIARRLRASPAVALAATAAQPLLPIFLARLSLAYFPALVGHAVDGLLVLFLLARRRHLDRPQTVVGLGALLATALLTYTQSVLNFGILLPLFLGLQMGFDHSRGARRRQAGLTIAGLLGIGLALVAFYGRYIPISIDMWRGVAMPEEQIVLDNIERWQAAASPEERAPEKQDDPYAGPGIDPLRGLQKASWRLYVFYGPFAPLVLVGLVLLLRGLDGDLRRFAVAWALTYLLLNLASGGLPGPNLVRQHKDIEVVAPLACLALGTLGARLWVWARLLAIGYGLWYWIFGAGRAVSYLTEKFR